MPKILIANTLYSPYIGGGAEIICQSLSERLKRKGYDVYVLTNGHERRTVKDRVNGIHVIRLRKTNLYFPKQSRKPSKIKRLIWHLFDVYNVLAKREIAKVLDEIQPDVAMCHNIAGFSISIWKCLMKKHIPIIQILHDQYLKCPNSNAFKNGRVCKKQCFQCRLMRFPHKYISSKVDVVIGVSHFILNSMVNLGYFRKSRKYVIHNAMEIEDINKQDFWDGTRPIKIGYIGTLTESKGIDLLIDVFMSMAIDAELLIAGRGNDDYEGYLKGKAYRDKRIKFLGYQNPSDFYQGIDVCVLPSVWQDTFPGVAYESCAHYVPVIGANIGGIPEIIHNKRNGILFKSGDSNSLYDALYFLYNNPQKLREYSEKSRDEVKEMLDVETCIERYEKVIRSICF